MKEKIKNRDKMEQRSDYKIVVAEWGLYSFALRLVRSYTIQNPEAATQRCSLQLYWNHTSTCVFSCKFAAYFQKTFSQEHLWVAAFENLTFQIYHTLNYFIRFLLNFKSFSSYPYKESLMKCLIDSSFKICNNWNPF